MIDPTDSELQSIKAFEYNDMHKASLRVSGSKWTSEHVNALHVTCFKDVPSERFLPEYMPRIDDQEYLSILEYLLVPPFGDVKHGRRRLNELLGHNPFKFFLSLAIATRQAEDEDD